MKTFCHKARKTHHKLGVSWLKNQPFSQRLPPLSHKKISGSLLSIEILVVVVVVTNDGIDPYFCHVKFM